MAGKQTQSMEKRPGLYTFEWSSKGSHMEHSLEISCRSCCRKRNNPIGGSAKKENYVLEVKSRKCNNDLRLFTDDRKIKVLSCDEYSM